MFFDADKYWKKHEKDCPYAEGNRCFISSEPGEDSPACKGCRWFEAYKKESQNGVVLENEEM